MRELSILSSEFQVPGIPSIMALPISRFTCTVHDRARLLDNKNIALTNNKEVCPFCNWYRRGKSGYMENSGQEGLVIFTDDVPNKDAFGPHSKIAEVLAQFIINNDQGHAIGLEGTWGSGKSAVLSFLNDLLNDENQKTDHAHELFVFDAWAHEGDELRRSFLDELNTFLHDEGALADELRKKIWQEKERIETDRKTTVPARAIFFALSIVLIPFYAAILNVIDLEFLELGSFGLFEDDTWWVRIIFLLILVPGGMTIVGLLAVAWLKLKRGKNLKDAFMQIFNFLRTQDNSQTTDITRTPSSSYREFRDSLRMIVKARAKRSGKLIIAIDNIDRLDGEKAKLFWSSLAPFFDRAASEEKKESHADETALSRIWLIIPFSEEHLLQMFDMKEEVRDGFIEKTFDLVLEVPPPALTKWQEFLTDHLIAAFPELASDGDELARIIRLYDLNDGKLPTPRHLKQFVNRITITRAQLVEPDKIPLRAIACFVLCKPDYDSSSAAKSKNYEIEHDIRDTLNLAGYQTIFAAIQYGVLLKDAPQAFMLDPLTTAIQKGESRVLRTLAKVPGFVSVLNTAVSNYVPLSAGATVVPTVIAVKSLSSAALDDVPTGIWIHLGRAFARAHNWRECVQDWQTITSAIIDNLPDKERDSFQAEVRKKLYGISVEPWPDDQDMIALARAWHEIAKLVSPKGEAIDLPIGARLSVGALAFYADENSNLADCPYNPTESSEQLLTEENIAGLNSEQVVGVAMVLYLQDSDALTHIPVDQLISDLNTPSSYSAEQVVAKLSLVLAWAVVSKAPNASEKLNPLMTTGILHHHIGADSGQETIVATLAATIIGNPQNTQPPQNYEQTTNGFNRISPIVAKPSEHPAIIEALSRIFLLSKSETILLRGAANYEQIRSLAITILNELIDHTETISFTTDDFVFDASFWNQLEVGLSVDEQSGVSRLLNKCSEKSKFLDAVIATGFDEEQALAYRHLTYLAQEISHAEFLNFITKGLTEVSASQWLEELSCSLDDEDSLVILVRSLKESKDSFVLGYQVRDAIGQATSGILNGSIDADDFFPDTISALIEFLPESEREGVEKRVLREMLSNPNGEYFKALYELLNLPNYDERTIYSESNRFMDALDQFTEEEATEGLQVIKELLGPFPKLYSKATQTTRSRIKSRLLGAENSDDEEASSLVKEIIIQLKIKRPKR